MPGVLSMQTGSAQNTQRLKKSGSSSSNPCEAFISMVLIAVTTRSSSQTACLLGFYASVEIDQSV
ncbi:hypothetical protein Dimus_001399, partial [Dionaea muscipula]